MATLKQQIEELDQAIADGVRQVTIGGDTTTLNTTDSLLRARDRLQEQYNQQQARDAGKRPSKRTRLFYAGRGY